MIITPIAFQDPPLLNAAGLHAPYALRIILEIISDDNITGVGEMVGGTVIMACLEKARTILIGMNPFERNKIRMALDRLRKAFGTQMPLRIDPNAVWTLPTAVAAARKLEGYLQYLEDPCRGQANMAEMRKHTSIPLATNMCTTSFEELPQAIALGSEDIILSDHHFWGGLEATTQLGRICSVFGRKLSMHSNSHLGISLMAMAHLGCAIPELAYELDTHYPWQSDESIKGGRIRFEEGGLSVSNEPGLGIELDHKILKVLHQTYLDCGIRDRDDETEMRKIDPSWRFRWKRW